MLKKFILLLSAFAIIVLSIFSVSFLAPKTAMASSYNQLTQLPFMGWSSWSSIRKNPTEENMKTAADILAEKFKQHGYQYINLDDFYQLNWTTNVDKYGRWVVDPRKFPDGMKALGDYIHSKGLKFGLYVTPGIPKGAVDQNTPIEGTPYHAKDITDLTRGLERNYNFLNMYYINYSKRGAQEFIDSWARLFASYGIDYLKIDGVGSWDIPDIEAWAKALKKTGRPIHLELSNNLDIKSASTWKQLSNGWRTGDDVESYTSVITDWKHVSKRFSQAASWAAYAGPGGWNDYDSLDVANGSRDGLTNDEKRSYVSLWAIAASQFVIGSDLTKLDDYGISLLTNDEIIGADQSGVAGKRLFSTPTSQVFYQHLPDGSYNIGIFNTSPSTHNISVNWSELGINGPAKVHDMWSHRNLGTFASGYRTSFSAHASRMIHVVPASTLTVIPQNGAMEINAAHVHLSWSTHTGANGYHVQVAADPVFSKIVADKMASSPAIIVDHLKTDTHYYWKVTTFSGGIETLAGIYSFTTKETTTPSAPDWVMANRNDKDSVSLTWNPVHGPASYTVYRRKINSFGDGDSYMPIATGLTDPSFVDKTAPSQSGVKYVYYVTAKNAIGESAKSSEAEIDSQVFEQLAAAVIILFALSFLTIVIRTARGKYKSSRPISSSLT